MLINQFKHNLCGNVIEKSANFHIYIKIQLYKMIKSFPLTKRKHFLWQENLNKFYFYVYIQHIYGNRKAYEKGEHCFPFIFHKYLQFVQVRHFINNRQ